MYDIRNYFIEDLKIHTETSWWTKTAKDPYTNILRNTTEAMAGILGGCSSISILPHDIVINDHDDVYFSKRIARNVSNILKEEAYLNKISDPVAGTYYIESLTNMMLVKIWDVVQEIETQGGFIAAFKTGYIKNMVKPNFEYSIASFIKEKKKIVGANYFKNQEDIDLVNKVKKTRKGWFEWDRLTETSEGK
jgi:methylmalonyl-CoA mutase